MTISEFDYVKFSIFNRLFYNKNGRSDKSLLDTITNYMRYHSDIIYQHISGDTYHFSDVDIDIIYNRILSDITPR